MPFKIAVIGCGWVSTACHGPAYLEYARTHSEVILSACCDADPQRAETFRDRFGFQRAYTQYSEMLEKERPHAVALNVPPQLISPLGCDILDRGLPLLCEKPPGLSLGEIDRLINAAQSSGVIHQVAFNRRCMPLVLELKRQLDGLGVRQGASPGASPGASRAIDHLEAQQARVRRTDENFATTAVHLIDLLRFLADSDYARIGITYQELPEQGPGVANFLLDGAFASGATFHLGVFPVTGLNVERTALYARDHTFFLQANNGPDSPGQLLHYQNGQLIAGLSASQLTGRSEDYFLNGFFHEDAAFFDAVQAGRQPRHDFRSCRQSIEIMQYLIERKVRYSLDIPQPVRSNSQEQPGHA